MANQVMAVPTAPCSAEMPVTGMSNTEKGEFLGVLNQNLSSADAGAIVQDESDGAEQIECGEEIDGLQEDAADSQSGVTQAATTFLPFGSFQGDMTIAVVPSNNLALPTDVQIPVAVTGEAPSDHVGTDSAKPAWDMGNSADFKSNMPVAGWMLMQAGSGSQTDGLATSLPATVVIPVPTATGPGAPPFSVAGEGAAMSDATAAQGSVSPEVETDGSQRTVANFTMVPKDNSRNVGMEQATPKLVTPEAMRESSAEPVKGRPAGHEGDPLPAVVARVKGSELAEDSSQGTSEKDAFRQSLSDRDGEIFREQAISARFNLVGKQSPIVDGMVAHKTDVGLSGTVSNGPMLQRFERIQQFMDNVGRHVLMLVKGDTKQMTVTLIPGELGRVVLHCQDTGNGIAVKMHAENPAAYGLLQRQEGDVRSALTQQGYNMTRFEVGTWNERGQERQGGGDRQRAENENVPIWADDGKWSNTQGSAATGDAPIAGKGGRFWAIA